MKPIVRFVSATGHVRRLAIVAALASVGFLTACESTGPKVDGSNIPIPGAYRNAAVIAEPVTSANTIRSDWWTQYGSDELNRLVDRSLAHNADLRVATLQVAQAKIRADQARAGRLPLITAPVRAVVQGQGTTTDSQQNSQASLAGSFRLDVWGEQRALVDSAEMQLARAVRERENVQRNTIGNLVNAYIAYLSVSDSMSIARENEAVAAEVLLSVKMRLALGDATANDLEQQQAVLFSQQAILPGLENQQEDLRSAISRLVGALSGNLVLTERGLDALQPPTLQVGLPSALLFDRPDIRMMEARMRAANANIDVARARLLPPIDLSAQIGYSGATLVSLLQPQNFLASTAAALALTIFDGGVKKGEKAYAQSYYEEMVETYGKTVLQAIREVESALVTLKTTNRRLDAQKSMTRSALNLYKIGNEAYAAGAIDQTALLESRKNYQRSADETQRVKAELLRSQAALAYALGMGSRIVDASVRGGSKVAQQPQLPDDLRVGMKDGVPTLEAFQVLAIKGEGYWEVEIPGVYHHSSLIPLWRDLHTRFSVSGDQLWLRAVHLDHVEGVAESNEAWYRLSAYGFVGKDGANAYCTVLRGSGQNCNVALASTGR
jgi:NodT family efflux transporter outer membrane factor (OMF) lipoprotein